MWLLYSALIGYLLIHQNYNKSRIHSCRGAHHVIITLDNQVVFDGELARYIVLYKNLIEYCIPLIRASGELSSESIDGYGDVREVCVY